LEEKKEEEAAALNNKLMALNHFISMKRDRIEALKLEEASCTDLFNEILSQINEILSQNPNSNWMHRSKPTFIGDSNMDLQQFLIANGIPK
jgi:hypothetical protein